MIEELKVEKRLKFVSLFKSIKKYWDSLGNIFGEYPNEIVIYKEDSKTYKVYKKCGDNSKEVYECTLSGKRKLEKEEAGVVLAKIDETLLETEREIQEIREDSKKVLDEARSMIDDMNSLLDDAFA